jgi:hypothetical protein
LTSRQVAQDILPKAVEAFPLPGRAWQRIDHQQGEVEFEARGFALRHVLPLSFSLVDRALIIAARDPFLKKATPPVYSSNVTRPQPDDK